MNYFNLICIDICFFCDILVYRHRFEDHERYLRAVLELLQDHQFTVNWKKCTFGQKLIIWGTYVLAKRVTTNPQKVQGMRDWPSSGNLHDLRGFLGSIEYC